MESGLEAVFLLISALTVSFGGAITAIYAFKTNFLMVFIGYLILIIGYKFSWYGCKTFDSFKELKEVLKPSKNFLESHFKNEARNYFYMLFGIVLSSFGTVIFGEIVKNNFSVLNIVLSSILCFGGYMAAHEGVNEVLI